MHVRRDHWMSVSVCEQKFPPTDDEWSQEENLTYTMYMYRY